MPASSPIVAQQHRASCATRAAMMCDQHSINEAAAAGRPRMKRRQASPVMLDQRCNDLRRERPAMRPPACIVHHKMRSPRDETRAHVRMVSSAAASGGGRQAVEQLLF
ncbi:small heat shock protein, chloroplastic-like [Dorcoceras hygrometricum]|uniref:Small heat shock protein, chloroplastic-like n=1 Tax=Dorcoceras hygrometricum TaxID=472368 RepID=A0A2Z6ZS69_9LAMI|nr:small heat shock protein, chloroplastic-like [Dorcoceras hygrometricum]